MASIVTPPFDSPVTVMLHVPVDERVHVAGDGNEMLPFPDERDQLMVSPATEP